MQVVTDYNEYLEGVKIWYNGTSLNNRHATEFEIIGSWNATNSTEISKFSLHRNYSMTTVHNSGSSSHVLTGLMPYAQYDVFLMPFYKLLLGKPSNMKSGFTEEDGRIIILSKFRKILLNINCIILITFTYLYSAISTATKCYSWCD